MRLDDALRIPGAYAVALLAADGPALTWWGRSPTDEQARAAAGIGRSAADLVRLGSADTRPDTLDDVLVTSADAFHVLRLLPGADGAGRVAHLMLRRAGANLAMARHDFRRLTAAYVAAEQPTAAEPVAAPIPEPVAEPAAAPIPGPVAAPIPESIAEPISDEPVLVEAVSDEPVSDEPVRDEPVLVEPVVDEPVLGEPVVDEPVESVVAESVSGEFVPDGLIVGEGAPGDDVAVGADDNVGIDGEDFAGAAPGETDAGPDVAAQGGSPRHAVDEGPGDDEGDLAVAGFLDSVPTPAESVTSETPAPEPLQEAPAAEPSLDEPAAQPSLDGPVAESPLAELGPEGAGSGSASGESGGESAGVADAGAGESGESVDNPGLGLRTDEQDAPGVEPDALAVEDRQTEPLDKPLLPRREPSTDKFPPAPVAASATPSAWLDLLGQPFLNDEQVLERVLGSLKGL